MSETDIYKKREAMPMGKSPEKKPRRRRSGSRRAFDDHSRKRRSKNAGIRRLLHLSRKSEYDKLIWGSVGIFFVVVLVIVAVWQFLISEHLIRDQEKNEIEYIRHQPNMPEVAEDGTPQSGDEPGVQ